MLTRKTLFPVLSVVALAAGCVGSEHDANTDYIGVNWDDPSVGPEGRWPGQTDFESAAPWSRIWGPWLRTMADGVGLEAAGAPQRVVEEGDIVKVAGNRAFVLNPYRGLMRVEIGNPDQPTISARLKLQGSPSEMYVVGDKAFVLMNGVYSWTDEQDYRSSLLVVDVNTMKLVSEHRVDGSILESRLVGEALYVVSDEWSNESQEQTTHVFSLDVSAPSAVKEVERVSFPGNGHVIHVTPDYLFVAKYKYPGTDIQVIDIRSPEGHLYVGNNVTLPGYVQDRFMMDYTDGHLRVVSHQWDDGGHIFVDTFALNAATTQLSHTGTLDLAQIGSLTAARFDGTRAYLVHMVRVDPLDVIDLSDPQNPALLDRIEIPGWLERLEVRDSRIVGVGFDQADTPAPQKQCPGYVYEPLASGRKLSVALFDVSDAGDVCEAARVRFGSGEWQWSNGFYDDKALKYIAESNLMLIPVNEYQQNSYFQGVQLVDVDLGTMELQVRGLVENASQVERSFLAQSRLMALGNRELTVANIANRDNPVVTANLELARNVVDFQPIPGKSYGVQLVGEYDEPGQLRIVPVNNADAERTDALSIIDVGASAGQLYVNNTIVTVYSRSYTEAGPQAKLTNFDVKNPNAPVKLGTLDFPVGYGHDIRPMMLTRYVPTADIVRVRNDLFVVSAPTEEGTKYSVISNAKPSAPKVTFEHVKANDKAQVLDLKAWWDKLYVVSTLPVEDNTLPIEGDHVVATDLGEQPDLATSIMPMPPQQARRDRVKYYVSRVTFSKKGMPTIGTAVNVPGRLVDVAEDGKILTFLDNRWEKSEDISQQRKELFTVKVNWGKNKAPLLDGVPLTQGVEDVKVRGTAAYYTETWQEWSGPIVPLADTVEAGQEIVVPEPAKPRLELVVLDYVDPAKIHEASRTTINETGSYGTLQDVRTVDGARYAFVQLGWGGLSVMNVTNKQNPFLREFVRTDAWSTKLVVSPDHGAAFMAGGYYGVETLDLSK